jgi:cation diffusion facilitator CzcD-associated flavoprotein CzcO
VPAPADPSVVPHHRVAVIGAGFGGVGTLIRLRQRGITDAVAFERAAELGGTWRDNSYPGCQCDVPSHLYSFSFAPNPDWSRSFALQPEIQAYLRRTADEHGVQHQIRTGHEVLDARWVPGAQRWALRTSGGDHTADVVVSAHGGLSAPSIPQLAGLDTFGGTVFHSARWNHDHDLRGERVAVIGTGASAIQIVPHVARDAAHLSVFQRSAPWVLPRIDRPIPARRRALYRQIPAAQKLNRLAQYLGRETMVPVLTRRPALGRRLERIALTHLHQQVDDADLRERLTPQFALGCKRILLSNDWYPALTRPDVSLVTSGIEQVDAAGITTADGTHHDLDTIILATGFAATDHPIAAVLHGTGGRSLRDAWQAGMAAHLGLSVPGFPNLFLLMGPNTGLGHSSIIYMLESQIAYIVDALVRMERSGIGVLDVRRSVAERFSAEMQRRLTRSVWSSGGCGSWYLDAEGRNPTMWPGFTFEYRHRTRRIDLADHHIAPALADGVGPEAPGVLITTDDTGR